MKNVLKTPSLGKHKNKLGMAIYLLPNMFTTVNVFCGFFAVIRSIEGFHTQAALAIIAATIFDMFDGRVARLTKTTSEFGLQYDSLADLISFCLAPSLLLFDMALKGIGRMGWTLCFFYFICGALRLARFNIQTKKLKDTNFVGLPSPAAALFITTFVIMYAEVGKIVHQVQIPIVENIIRVFLSPTFLQIFFIVISILLGLLMVSNVRYSSFKDLNKIKQIRPFYALVISIFILVLLVSSYEFIGFLIIFSYTIFGAIRYILTPSLRTPPYQVEDDDGNKIKLEACLADERQREYVESTTQSDDDTN